MISNTSPKSQKLLEFRDKLARMNGTTLLANQREKLKQIIDHNKIIQSDISSIFDEISEHYLKWEHQITTINANIIQFVQSNKKKLINLVENLKERELDAIKEDVDQYIKFQKKVKKLSLQLDNTKGKKQALVQSIGKIKPYNTKNIYLKMEQMQPERQKIQDQIKKFSKLEQTMINLQEINDQDFSIKKERREEENKIQSYQNVQKMSEILFSSRSSHKLREQQRIFNSNGNIANTASKNNLSRYNLIEHLKTDKTSEKEQNLISEQDRVFRKEDDNKFQFKNPQPSEQAQEMDGKTQKLTTNQYKREKKFNVERKQSQQMGGSSQLKYSIDKFLLQLKKGNPNQQEHQMSSREELSIADHNTKYTAISRVKSQENLLSQYKRKTGRQSDNVQVTTQIPRIKKIGEKVISSTAFNTSQAQNRANECKNSRTGRRGNWASILKQQQAKYNEMRKRLKN